MSTRLDALDAFHEDHPHAGEAVFFTASDLAGEAGMPSEFA